MLGGDPDKSKSLFDITDEDIYKEIDSPSAYALDTIVIVGAVGTGKSSLANILALRDDQEQMPPESKLSFAVGSGEGRKTVEPQVKIVQSKKYTRMEKIKIIDMPGLDLGKSSRTDDHVQTVCQAIKQET